MFHSGSVFPGRTQTTWRFLYFYFFFVSSALRESILPNWNLELKERQIAVDANNPFLVDFFVQEMSQILWWCNRIFKRQTSKIYTNQKISNDRISRAGQKESVGESVDGGREAIKVCKRWGGRRMCRARTFHVCSVQEPSCTSSREIHQGT